MKVVVNITKACESEPELLPGVGFCSGLAVFEQVFVELSKVLPVGQVMHLAGSAAEQEPQLLATVHVAVQAAWVEMEVLPVKSEASASFPLPSVQAVHVPTVSVPILADR